MHKNISTIAFMPGADRCPKSQMQKSMLNPSKRIKRAFTYLMLYLLYKLVS